MANPIVTDAEIIGHMDRAGHDMTIQHRYGTAAEGCKQCDIILAYWRSVGDPIEDEQPEQPTEETK